LKLFLYIKFTSWKNLSRNKQHNKMVVYFFISMLIVFLHNVGSALFSDVLDIPESLDEINQIFL
jgi:hypothetical protein